MGTAISIHLLSSRRPIDRRWTKPSSGCFARAARDRPGVLDLPRGLGHLAPAPRRVQRSPTSIRASRRSPIACAHVGAGDARTLLRALARLVRPDRVRQGLVRRGRRPAPPRPALDAARSRRGRHQRRRRSPAVHGRRRGLDAGRSASPTPLDPGEVVATLDVRTARSRHPAPPNAATTSSIRARAQPALSVRQRDRRRGRARGGRRVGDHGGGRRDRRPLVDRARPRPAPASWSGRAARCGAGSAPPRSARSAAVAPRPGAALR